MPDSPTRTPARGTLVARHATRTTVQHAIDTQHLLFTTPLRSAYTGMRLLFALQDAGLEASLRALETWRATARPLQRSLLDQWGTWLGLTERAVAASEQATKQVVDRATQGAEQLARHAEAAGRQPQPATQRKQERDQREHGDERRADRPAINVVKREDDWAVVRDDASRPSRTFDTKREAVARARELAQRSGAEVHVESATGARRRHTGAANGR
jgi:hypothetical protein